VELGDETGEYCGLLLTGLGAEVIKVEPLDGVPSRHIGPFYRDLKDPEMSLHFWAYNRGKRSLTMDFKQETNAVTLRQLIQSCDVLIDSTPRGFLAGLAIDTSEFPSLIHARLTPFGDDGPWADFKTSDLVSLALGGVTMNCGYDPEPDGTYDLPPIAPQVWHSFHIAGEQLAIGITAALIRRQQTDKGQHVAVSIHEAVSKNTELDVTNWVMLRQPLYRQTCRHASPTITDPSIAYTKDGRWLLAMSLGMRDRVSMQPFMARYGLADGVQEETTTTPELVRSIGGSTAAATSNSEVVQRLVRRFTYEHVPWHEAQADGLIWSPIRKPHENATDEHWLSRGTFADIDHPELARSFRYPISKWISTAGSWEPGRRAPRLAEDNASIIASLAEPSRTNTFTAKAPQPNEPEALSALGQPFPLQGVRILDFTWFLASAGSTRFLASLGADVLKVEWKTHPDSGRGSMVPEGGRKARERATAALTPVKDSGIGGQFNNKNPGKRGLSLNVADPVGLEIAKALVPKCDVVAEGFSPGVVERWGLGYDVLKALRSDIIYVKQSGMGAFGRYGRFRCLGPIAAALSGVSEMSGLPEPAPPAGWGYSYLDWFGAYSMALSVLTALYHREQTGQGQWIDASQTEVGIFLTAEQILDWSANGREWHRSGNRSPYHPAAPHGIYPCSGTDRWIAIACFTDDEWKSVAEMAKHPEWVSDARFRTLADRIANQDALDQSLSEWTRAQDASSLMYALQALGVASGVCQTAEDRYESDPQLAHLDWLTELQGTRIGTWPLAETSIRFSETPAHIGGLTARAAPLYGEDNVSILTDLLGMTEREVADLAEKGII
jgi:crotonobetainyl-CoA:carnitine CoA-transferase CaiB-like acyl-CoA transferase